jgi:CubicO group peptidase (beta-lactamase class C family)
VPWMFKRSASEIRYRFQGNQSSLADYLSRNPVTGLVIAKDDRILFEQYQYDRTDRDRLVAQSMVKSITGLLIGIAISTGAIKSVDDTAEAYVPGFKGTEYGKTPIRDLLHMSSGVEFGEASDGERDLKRLWRDMVAGSLIFKKGTINSIVQFNRRIAPPGTRYSYASIEPDVLGVVLRYATGKSASDYLQEKVWRPIGAEADATWLVDAEGFELAHFGFSAVMRDYARLGRLLAHDGAWEGKQIIPAQLDDRGNDGATVGRLFGAGQPHAMVWLRLSVVAASREQAPVCNGRRLWSAHLHRSGLKACHGPDRPRQHERRGLAFVVGAG